MRAFLRLRLKSMAPALEPRDMAEAAELLANMGIYSPELSEVIKRQLTWNPYHFERSDLKRLLPHFGKWELGPSQRQAFQSLGNRLAEVTEYFTPREALLAIEAFASVGSTHEVMLQHMFLRLLLERSFLDLPTDGVARLCLAMSRVEHYNTGLLREIVEHLGEDPMSIRTWSPDDLSAALRCCGLAPVEVPEPVVRLLAAATRASSAT